MKKILTPRDEIHYGILDVLRAHGKPMSWHALRAAVLLCQEPQLLSTLCVWDSRDVDYQRWESIVGAACLGTRPKKPTRSQLDLLWCLELTSHVACRWVLHDKAGDTYSLGKAGVDWDETEQRAWQDDRVPFVLGLLCHELVEDALAEGGI